MKELDNLPSPSCAQRSLLEQLSFDQLVSELMRAQQLEKYNAFTIAGLQAKLQSVSKEYQDTISALAKDLEAAHERIADLQGGQNAAI